MLANNGANFLMQRAVVEPCIKFSQQTLQQQTRPVTSNQSNVASYLDLIGEANNRSNRYVGVARNGNGVLCYFRTVCSFGCSFDRSIKRFADFVVA